jgi:urea transport system permease protein
MRVLFLALFCWLTFSAHASVDPALVQQLASEESDDKIAAILQIAQTAEPEALTILQSLSEGTLTAPDGSEITLNNRVRGELANALAGLKLFDPDRKVRLAAAKELQTNVGIEMAPLLARALEKESDAAIKTLLVAAHAQANLTSPEVAARLAAVKSLAASPSPGTRALLLPLTQESGEPDMQVRIAAIQSLKSVESSLADRKSVV